LKKHQFIPTTVWTEELKTQKGNYFLIQMHAPQRWQKRNAIVYL